MTASSSQEQADLYSVVTTLVVFGFITACIYYLLLKPILHLGEQETRAAAAIQQQQRYPDHEARRRRRHRRQAPRAPQTNNNHDDLDFLTNRNEVPSHVNPNSHAGLGGTNLLVDGLVPFRHSRAAVYVQDEEEASKLRRDRARVMARLLALSSGSTPPSRGSTVVVSVQHVHINCPKLRRVLFLLGTYYNLMVMLSFDDDNNTDVDKLLSDTITKLRGDRRDETHIPPQVLPNHHIVASRSVTGRVAFVRQLARVEIVLDYDPAMKTQLGRFGFHVYIYDDANADGGDSPLGNALLP